MNDTGSNDLRIEVIIGSLLRAGVLLAASVVLLGGVVYEIRHGSEMINYATFHGEPEEFRKVPAIIQGAISFHGRSIIQLGLLLLIATPIARVLFSAVAFVFEKDYLYVVVTLIVLAVLLYSLLGSAG